MAELVSLRAGHAEADLDPAAGGRIARLRVDGLRVFYDVEEETVIVHGIVEKPHAAEWLAEKGEPL